MKPVHARENLGYGILSDDGDVLPADDVTGGGIPMANAGRLELSHSALANQDHLRDLAAYEQREADISRIRQEGDFSQRNQALKGLVSAIGKHNEKQGAAHLYAEGRAQRIRGASKAEQQAGHFADRAKRLGSAACEACPLQQYCAESGQITSLLMDTDQVTRQRFRTRVGSGSSSQDNFCATNLRPGVIPKHLK